MVAIITKPVLITTLIVLTAITFVSYSAYVTSRQKTSLNIKASGQTMTVVGTLIQNGPNCESTFYIGCYELNQTNTGITYRLLDSGNKIDFQHNVNKIVSLSGTLTKINNMAVLQVSTLHSP